MVDTPGEVVVPQILDIPSAAGPFKLEWDKGWLSILKLTESCMRYNRSQWFPPSGSSDAR